MLVNAIEHGNLGIDFHEKSRLKEQDCWQQEVERRLALPENREKYVRIEIARVGAEWEFLIADQGEGFAWADFLEFSPERAFAPNGRGIVLARQLAFSSMEFEGGGNCVRVRAAIPENFARVG